jgi:hypothetical protein
LKIEVVREAISQDALVMPGLDPGIHQSWLRVFSKRWITGSSPVMLVVVSQGGQSEACPPHSGLRKTGGHDAN